jgi:autotransporter-associated beta strand protein
MKRLLVPFVAGLLPAFVLIFSVQTGRAESATWKQNPTSGDWNTAANWTPSTVPNGPSDIAMFASSNFHNVSLSANTEVNVILFSPGASAFTITVTPTNQSTQFTVSGGGITNNTGVIQNFVVAGPNVARGPFGNITFLNTATAGEDNIHLMIEGGTANSSGAEIFFSDHSSAGSATLTVNGGPGRNGNGGLLRFDKHSTAGNSSLIAAASVGPAARGGVIAFNERSDGGTARVQLFGSGTEFQSNGSLEISAHTMSGGGPGPVTIGSLEGDGTVFLGPATLVVGSNNMNTGFSGVISWMGSHGGIGGGVVKIGTGKLVLTNGNTYVGGTTIKRGELVVNNRTGSGTGDGPVQVERGTLGGKGTIAGAVTIGTGSGGGAFLAPGYLHGAGKAGALTIQGLLTFNGAGVYEMQVNSSSAMADEVAALGVVINSGAKFAFADIGNSTLPIGTVFTIINNTSATPIAGTFSNLRDGTIFISNRNIYQVSYEGGDGNDLTLTVVP